MTETNDVVRLTNKKKLKALAILSVAERGGQFIKINWNKRSVHLLDYKGTKRVIPIWSL